MYHIPNDKRSRRSAALICEGLMEKLRNMPYDQINITKVCAQNGIARTTFYRLFDTLDDVLLYQFDSLLHESTLQYSNAKESYSKIILKIAMRNQTLLTAVINSKRTDLFDFTSRMKEGAAIQNLELQIDETDWLYCSALLSNILYGAVSHWVKSGCRETVDELYEIVKRTIKIVSESF